MNFAYILRLAHLVVKEIYAHKMFVGAVNFMREKFVFFALSERKLPQLEYMFKATLIKQVVDRV